MRFTDFCYNEKKAIIDELSCFFGRFSAYKDVLHLHILALEVQAKLNCFGLFHYLMHLRVFPEELSPIPTPYPHQGLAINPIICLILRRGLHQSCRRLCRYVQCVRQRYAHELACNKPGNIPKHEGATLTNV